MVAINYRLGALGFLSIPHLNITGNMGLKDQQLALEWTHRNIRQFGGDPNRITLAGWSAGAAAVNYHMFNKQSRRLFQRAIAMSGTMLHPWAFAEPATGNWCGRNYLDYVGLETKAQLQAVDFLELVPRVQERLMVVFFGMSHFCFLPTIEPDWAVRPFLVDAPPTVSPGNHNVSLLIGFTALEIATLYPVYPNYHMAQCSFPNANDSLESVIQTHIDSYVAARFHNDGDQALFWLKLASMADMFYDIRRFMDAYSAADNAPPVYGYQFAFDGRFGHFKQRENPRWHGLKGAVHGDELGYLFVPFYENIAGSQGELQDEIQTAQQMVEMWTNFVKFG